MGRAASWLACRALSAGLAALLCFAVAMSWIVKHQHHPWVTSPRRVAAVHPAVGAGSEVRERGSHRLQGREGGRVGRAEGPAAARPHNPPQPHTAQHRRASESQHRALAERRRGRQAQCSVVSEGACAVQPLTYTSSALEQRWLDSVKKWQSDDPAWPAGCAAAQADEKTGVYSQWLEAVRRTRAAKGATARLEPSLDPDVFSTFEFCDTCTGRVARVLAEPLASTLRNPRFPCVAPPEAGCKGNAACESAYGVMDTGYLLVPSEEDVRRRRVGNNGSVFFFDLGSTYYDTGLVGEVDSFKWFKETYERRGVPFDHVYAWEAKKDLDHTEYWSRLPDDMYFKMTFYNIPVTAQEGHPSNPLTHVLRRTASQDYVILKVDLDDNPLEEAIIAQLKRSPELLRLVDEVYWEHHVSSTPLAAFPYWGPQSGTTRLSDSYKSFLELRQLGIVAHSWV